MANGTDCKIGIVLVVVRYHSFIFDSIVALFS